MENQIQNMLKKDPSRSDDFLSSYSCSKFEKCSFEQNALTDKSTHFIVKNFYISYLELICYSRLILIHRPFLQKSPAALLKIAKKNRNFQNSKLAVPLKFLALSRIFI